jgi:protein phosphatase 1 regulatory subunit 7
MDNLRQLVLRSCLIASMEGVETLTTLKHLELYDNQVEAISHIDRLTQLTVLDISFNCIRDMSPVAACPLLEELYIAQVCVATPQCIRRYWNSYILFSVQNKLRKIEGLAGLTRLRTLDLGANRIRVRLLRWISVARRGCHLWSFCSYRQVIEGLENCTALNSLWLGKNKIETVDGLETLVNLKQLDIQNNRLTSLGTGLQHLHQLQERYWACKGVPIVEGLPTVSQLQTIGAQSVDFYL